MKRIFALLLTLALLLCSAACADTLGEANLAYGGGGYICSFTAPNGQQICYISFCPQEDWENFAGEATDIPGAPNVTLVDANFDGTDDLLVTTVVGASNAFYAIYLWDDTQGQYVLADPGYVFDTDLPNVTFDADRQLVCTYGTNGWAGLMHEYNLFRWDGSHLVCIRTAVSDIRTTQVTIGGTILSYSSDETLTCLVLDHQTGDRVTLLEASLSEEDMQDEAKVAEYLDAELTALYEGL